MAISAMHAQLIIMPEPNVGYTQKGLSCNASHPCTYKNRRTLKIAKRKKNINST